MKNKTSQLDALQNDGVSFLNKESIEIRGNLFCGKGVVIDSNVIIKGKVILGDNVSIGSSSIIEDSVIESGSEIKNNSSIKNSQIGSNCILGPYCRIRSKTKIDNGSQIGNFVEIKKTMIGKECRINHMAFLGDSILEDFVTIGAGVITCNNDGLQTNETYIESNSFIGSNVNLIAPIRISKNSTIGSGSTITQNTNEDTLTIARSRQVSIDNWKGPKKNK